MNEEQRKCLERIKVAVEIALETNTVQSYEVAINRVQDHLETCPEP